MVSFVTTGTVTFASNFFPPTLFQGLSLSYMTVTSSELFMFILRLVTLTYSKVTRMLSCIFYIFIPWPIFLIPSSAQSSKSPQTAAQLVVRAPL